MTIVPCRAAFCGGSVPARPGWRSQNAAGRHPVTVRFASRRVRQAPGGDCRALHRRILISILPACAPPARIFNVRVFRWPGDVPSLQCRRHAQSSESDRACIKHAITCTWGRFTYSIEPERPFVGLAWRSPVFESATSEGRSARNFVATASYATIVSASRLAPTGWERSVQLASAPNSFTLTSAYICG